MAAVLREQSYRSEGKGGRVLLTGPFGTVGSHVLPHLIRQAYEVVCFDLDNEKNRQTQRSLAADHAFEPAWGDIRHPQTVRELVERVKPEAIIHLAAILPPLAYLDPELAHDVTVGGTRHLLAAAQRIEPVPKFVYTSSYSVHGPRNPYGKLPLLTGETPVSPADSYGRHKVAGEEMVRGSNLPWTILRLGSVMPTNLAGLRHPALVKYMFTMPLAQREHACDVRDVGLAIANVVAAETTGRTLVVAGGADWQSTVGQLRGRLFEALGIGRLPEDAFRRADPERDETWHYLDWMDTQESQALLRYQHHSLEDYIDRIRTGGLALLAMRLAAPLVRKGVVWSSPYAGQGLQHANRTVWEDVCQIFDLDPATE